MCDVPVPECMSCQRGEFFCDVKRFLLHTLNFVQNHRTKWGQRMTAIFVRRQCCEPMSYFVVWIQKIVKMYLGLLKFNCDDKKLIRPHCFLSIKKFNGVQM